MKGEVWDLLKDLVGKEEMGRSNWPGTDKCLNYSLIKRKQTNQPQATGYYQSVIGDSCSFFLFRKLFIMQSEMHKH